MNTLYEYTISGEYIVHKENFTNISKTKKTLVLYVFHEYNERVEHFINNALFKDDNVDFIFICNNMETKLKLPSYVKVIHRENIGYDFGGWSDGLFYNNIYKNYDYFIFANSSIIGPFLPMYYMGKWTDIYINGLKNNIKLFGSTINTYNEPHTTSHVQSYIFCMDREALEYLIKEDIFSKEYVKTFDDAIWKKEVLMSRKILDKGWNIGCLHSYYKGVDFTFKTKSFEDYKIKLVDDFMYQSYYDDKSWNILELVFIKGNRIKL